MGLSWPGSFFKSMDADQDGRISLEELEKYIDNIGVSAVGKKHFTDAYRMVFAANTVDSSELLQKPWMHSRCARSVTCIKAERLCKLLRTGSFINDSVDIYDFVETFQYEMEKRREKFLDNNLQRSDSGQRGSWRYEDDNEEFSEKPDPDEIESEMDIDSPKLRDTSRPEGEGYFNDVYPEDAEGGNVTVSVNALHELNEEQSGNSSRVNGGQTSDSKSPRDPPPQMGGDPGLTI